MFARVKKNAYFLTNQKEAYLYQGKHEILSDV
jgi:hypothetical protein